MMQLTTENIIITGFDGLLKDFIQIRGVAQPGSASALGAEGRRFKSCRPDKNRNLIMGARSSTG
jgi:hypothetical protein